MPSEIWSLTSQQAFEKPYNHYSQQQFINEGKVFLDEIFKILDKFNMKYQLDERSINKAVWMLSLDVLDALQGCLEFLQNKKHRIAGRLFRDIIETLDLAEYFFSNSNESNKNLNKWYNDEIIPNSVCRNYFKKKHGEFFANQKANHYKSMSRLIHKSYYALCQSYCLGKDDYIVHDSNSPKFLVLPQTIAQYMPIVAELIKDFSEKIATFGLVDKNYVDDSWHLAFKADN